MKGKKKRNELEIQCPWRSRLKLCLLELLFWWQLSWHWQRVLPPFLPYFPNKRNRAKRNNKWLPQAFFVSVCVPTMALASRQRRPPTILLDTRYLAVRPCAGHAQIPACPSMPLRSLLWCLGATEPPNRNMQAFTTTQRREDCTTYKRRSKKKFKKRKKRKGNKWSELRASHNSKHS